MLRGTDKAWLLTGRVGDTEVHDFAGLDEVVESVHHLLDRGGVVPEVDIEDVNVRRLELLERVVDLEPLQHLYCSSP